MGLPRKILQHFVIHSPRLEFLPLLSVLLEPTSLLGGGDGIPSPARSRLGLGFTIGRASVQGKVWDHPRLVPTTGGAARLIGSRPRMV